MSFSAGAVSVDIRTGKNDVKGSLQSLGSMAKGVGAKIGAALGAAGLAAFSKQCIDLASDLNEVQNVVDVTYSHLSDRVNQWASDASASYGLSETMAKQYAGTFGSMAESFGFTEEQAFAMSTALTGLAGDVASFYNMSQDAAYTKLKSVFSGETESLKELGVVMTQTALDAYALANGFGTTTDKMTEQEKVALRYAFVQSQLANASGDFARTSESWANQTRLLQLRFDSLKATVGQGMIAALLPVVRAINAVILGFQRAAEAVNSLIELVTGKPMAELTGGAEDAQVAVGDLADVSAGASESASDLTQAQEDAADAAKKQEKAQKALNQALAGFDKMNRLTSRQQAEKTEKTGASGAGTGISDQVLAASGLSGALASVNEEGAKLADIKLPDTLVDAFTNLKDAVAPFVELVKGGLSWAWENVLKPLGGWVMEEAAPAVVNLLAAAFNLFTKAAEALSPVFKVVWEKVFKPLAKFAGDMVIAMINGVALALNGIADFAEKHPTAFTAIAAGLAALFAVHKHSKGFVQLLTWSLSGTGLKGLTKLKMGPKLTKATNAVKKLFKVFAKNPVAIAIAAVVAGIALLAANWEKIRNTKVGQSLERLGEAIAPIAEKLSDLASNVLSKLLEAAGKVLDKVSPYLEEIGPVLENVVDAIADGLCDAIDWLADAIEDATPFIEDAVDWIGDKLKKAAELACAAVGALKSTWDTITDKTATLVAEAREKVSGALSALRDGWNTVKDRTAELVANAKDNLGKAWDNVKGAFTWAAIGLRDIAATASGTATAVLGNAWNAVKGAFDWAKNGLKNMAATASATTSAAMASAWNAVKGAFDWAKNGLKNFAGTVSATVSATLAKAWSDVKSAFKWAVDGLYNKSKEISGTVKASLSKKWGDIKKAFNWAVGGLYSKAAEIKATVTHAGMSKLSKIKKAVSWAASNLRDFVGSIGLKVSTAVADAKAFANGIIASINAKLHSLNWPSIEVLGKKIGGGQIFPGSASNSPIPQLAQGGWVARNTPRLAVIGDNRREGEIVSPESKLQAMADRAAENAGGTGAVEALLVELIAAVRSQDRATYLDGREITRSVVANINGQTQATGRCPVLV